MTDMLRPAVSVLTATVLAASLGAQTPAAPKIDFPAASPNATVQQRVGLTDIEVVYARPGVKGRKIFGELVPHGEVWRTGANNATKITFSTPVKVGGTDVPAGSYALFTIPAPTEWTIILNKVDGQWGSYSYDEKNDLMRVKAKPVALAEPVETFEIGWSDLKDSTGTLNLTWEKTRVPVKVETDLVKVLVPQIETAMAAEGKKPYFQAAMFYFGNDLDLKKAITWMDAGLAEQPEAFWMMYRKGLILQKMGDKKGATEAANKSLEMASKAEGAIKEEYTRLNKALLATLK